jgi:hypothetical protein
MVIVMKNINNLEQITFVSLIAMGLSFSTVAIGNVYAAAPPHPCFGGAQDYTCICDNNPAKLTATCCWYDPITGGNNCQTCEVNTDTGDFENCTSKVKPDSSVVAPSPSGIAPPTSTEQCPENVVADKNGNCSPSAQLPEEDNDSSSDDSKPTLRGNVLNDLMFSQSQDSSPSEEEQEEENNQTDG